MTVDEFAVDDLTNDSQMGEALANEERAEPELAEATTGRGGAIIVNDRFHIATDSLIPQLDSANAMAFACRDMNDPNHHCYALVSSGMLPPRADDLSAFRRVDRPSLLRPIEWGVSAWPGEEQRRFIIVMERPGGRRIAENYRKPFKPLTEDRITRNVIAPLIPVLRILSEIGMPHRGIRVDNLFYQDAVLGDVVLGEGYSAPPGLEQPVLFEPIDSAMAEPGGRGLGTIADDLYSFGVTLALMVMGRNPLADLSDDEIIDLKLREGTYNALLSDARVSLGMVEVLRGLLTDDATDRWNASEMDLWLSGRRLSPKQPKMPPKAQRGFRFIEREYHTAPTLARAFSKNWISASRAIATEPLDTWLKRGLENEKLGDDFNTAIRTAAAFGGRTGIEDRMVARTIIVLDPEGPIHYRDFVARAGGFETALMCRFVEAKDVEVIAHAINAKLPVFWLDNQAEQTAVMNLMRRNHEMMAYMLSRQGLGYGLERCLYELNPSCPCLSPLVRRFFVMNLMQLLPALDEAAVESGGEGEPMDAHLAAFIASRLKHSMDQHLQALENRYDDGQRRLGVIHLLAEVQQVTGQETPPHLVQWLVKISDPVVGSYRNRLFQKRLSTEVRKLAEKGTLMDMVYVLENTARREKDTSGFAKAVAEYTAAEQEINKIEGGEMTKPEVIEKKGQEVAAMASGLVASLTLVMILMIRLISGSVGGA